jgi:hypothetical protein
MTNTCQHSVATWRFANLDMVAVGREANWLAVDAAAGGGDTTFVGRWGATL